MKRVLYGLVFLSLVTIISGTFSMSCSNGTSTTPTLSAPAPTMSVPQIAQQATDAESSTSPSTLPIASEIEKGLVILNYSSYEDIQGLFRIVGEVENRGENNSAKNRITATFYDEQGLPEAEHSGYCYIEIMKPGDKSPFEIICPSAPRLEGFSLTAEGQITNKQAHMNMEVGDVKAAIDSDGYDTITGQVTNTNEKLIDIAMVIGSFYDSNGTLVTVGSSFCDRHLLNPNETANFTIMLDPNISSRISSRSLEAIGYE